MTIYLIVLVAVLNQMSFSGARVSISLYAIDQGASQFMVGILVALFALCPTLFAISIGKFADRTAPRVLMILASALNLVALVLPQMFSGLPVLFAMALIMGMSHPLFLIPLEATIGGVGGAEQRVRNYALLAMGWSISNFLGPIIAGFSIDHLGQRPVFMVLTAITLLPTLMLCVMPALLPRSGKHGGKGSRGSVVELWRMRPVRAALIASAIVGSAMDLFQFYFPIYGRAVGISASAIGTIIGMVSAAAFVIRGVLPLVVKKISEADMLTYSALTSALAFALLPFFANPYALAAIAFVLGLGVGCANPMTMSLLYALTPAPRISEAIGLNKAIKSFTHLIIPLAFGSIGGMFGFATVFLSNAVMLAAGGIMVRRVGRADGGGKT